MKKGVTVDAGGARRPARFTDAGVMVHAYLMYGFPTETEQETIDALERVRQLFAEGCIQSAFWHRFAATAHSPIGREPERLRHPPARAQPRGRRFARNELPSSIPTGCDHERLGAGLRKALYNYMHGVGLEQDVRRWFAPEAKARRRRARKARRRSRSRGAGGSDQPRAGPSPLPSPRCAGRGQTGAMTRRRGSAEPASGDAQVAGGVPGVQQRQRRVVGERARQR